jgi:hypothetical protein
VLLILHGGPGDVTNPWGYAYFMNGRNTSQGHFAAFIKSDEFLKDLVTRVRPLALTNAK